jgi:anti-sigma factor RsiW
MKTFEEKWTAWIDGEMSEAERAEFEASLQDRSAAEAEKLQANKLGALLREQLQPRAMGNEEFFHHQLRERRRGRAGGPFAVSSGPARPRWPSSRSALFSYCVKSRSRTSRNT